MIDCVMQQPACAITRPVLRYHGGKWLIAPWIIANLPPHKVYVEAFGGAASILMRKPRSRVEIYNDMDGRVVNVFRVLQDPTTAAALCDRLRLTPFARSEFNRCYEPAVDHIDAAWKTIGLSFMGFGSDSATRSCRTGFRSSLSDSRSSAADSWATYPHAVQAFIDRLRGVVIEQRDAVKVMQGVDRAEALHFVDPPYVHSTRSSLAGRGRKTHGYRFEMDDAAHSGLASTLHSLKGMVGLCGYQSELYGDLYRDWNRLDLQTLAHGAKRRTESLWFNGAAWTARAKAAQSKLKLAEAAL